VPVRLAIVLGVLSAIALVGALVQTQTSASPTTATTTEKSKPDPNRVVTARGPLPGAILIADRGNNRVILVDSHHNILWRFPTRADRARGEHLVFDDDTFVEPGGKALITNEEDHQAILSINIKKRRTRLLFGEPGVIGHDMTHLDWPDDAYMLPDGTVTVADAYNCRILFIRHKRIVRQIGSGVCGHNPPATLGSVNGDTPTPNGGVLVSEINGSWIDAFSKTGKLLWDFQAPVGYPSDPQLLSRGRILLADYSKPGAVLIVNRHGHVLWRYGPTAGAGELDQPSLAIMLPNGNIAVNDDFGHRVVIIDPKKRRIVWHYGHHYVAGRKPGYLNTPDGMDYIPLGVNEKPLWQLVHHP
jgi:outer membrane protein assembly factor BamB